MSDKRPDTLFGLPVIYDASLPQHTAIVGNFGPIHSSLKGSLYAREDSPVTRCWSCGSRRLVLQLFITRVESTGGVGQITGSLGVKCATCGVKWLGFLGDSPGQGNEHNAP